jgi:hypothetical protein
MMQSENISDLAAALSLAQGEMAGAAKDCNNPFFKSKYADLSSVWIACREPLSKNGLSVTQTMQYKEGLLFLVSTLMHKTGQYIKSELPVNAKSDGKTNELQTLGSCLTYLRRFSLSALVGVSPADDDDGNSGTNYGKAEPKKEAIISSQQASLLKSHLDACPIPFKNEVLGYLKGQKTSIERLPVDLYERLLNSCKKKAEENESNDAQTG